MKREAISYAAEANALYGLRYLSAWALSLETLVIETTCIKSFAGENDRAVTSGTLIIFSQPTHRALRKRLEPAHLPL